jgi:kumamolisin
MKKIFIGLLMMGHLQTSNAKQVYTTPEGTYIIPDASISSPLDAGKVMHTNLIKFKPNAYNSAGLPSNCETPASIACIYGLTPKVPGCPINGTTALPTGGWGAIALVEAYHYGNAENDLNTFSAQFGLPPCTQANGCFTIVYASGTQPPTNPETDDEHVLDIEWAHAMAPLAKIIMVEANSSSHDDLLAAVDVASLYVANAGGGMVSFSHSSAEYPGETNDDVHFQTPGVVYFASSGDDSAPANYPASSPYVIAAGGTSIVRDNRGNFIGETAWSTDPSVPNGGSGGPSLYEPRPSYQNSVMKIVGMSRGTPDISFNANPKTGVCTYSSSHGGWFQDGGTSVSAPALAGIINSAGYRARSSHEALTYIYTNALKNYHAYWHDILQGNNGYPALAGYDFTTGLGSPLGYGGK